LGVLMLYTMKNILLPFILFTIVSSLIAQKKITVEDFTLRNTFAQKSVTGINWMNDGKFYTSLAGNKIIKYSITTGQPVETIIDGSTVAPSVVIDDYSLSSDEKKLLILTNFQNIYRRSYTASYYVYDIATKSLQQLSAKGQQSYAAFAPDASKVAFVRSNNLFYVTLTDMSEKQITDDGKFNFIINGTTDWVYEEEFSFVNGFYWSPDGKKLAYYRFDESQVKEYNLQKWNNGQLYPQDYRFKYPKAGEANSIIEIWFHDLTTNQKVKADIGSEKDIYIPRVKWTKDANTLSIIRMNRLQNNLEILHTNATTGESKIVLQEKSESYIDLEYTDDLTYLNDKKHFIHASERSGFKHLYLYTNDGTLIKQITNGNYEVVQFLGIDEKIKTIYYLSTEISSLERHLYTISLDGKKKAKLSNAGGTHTINMSNDFQYYIDYHSSARQPINVTLYQAKGNTLVKVLEKNEAASKTSEEYQIVTREFFSFKTVDGTSLNGYFLKPKDFDPNKKYPVLLYQYSGPGSQNVTDAWGGSHYYFHQMLVQKGIIVAVIDNRGTGARGEKFKKLTYKQLGKYELEDHLESAKYFSSLPFVDAKRLAIWGWSYGGYISSLAMTKGAGTFKVGIAVAPVTNWRFYDNIYTERFLQRPQENAGGYDDNSPTTYANKLQGDFLLIHGTGDDNVHFQNSVALEEALINAGKQFRSFYYPDKHHGIQGGKARFHLYTMMTDYLLEKLEK
jgi:dipeptidyl-peptidase-4